MTTLEERAEKLRNKIWDLQIDSNLDFDETLEDIEYALREVENEALERQAEHCLCTRNTRGFDYGETHKKLGKPGIGKRWLTPSDIAKDALRNQRPVGHEK